MSDTNQHLIEVKKVIEDLENENKSFRDCLVLKSEFDTRDVSLAGSVFSTSVIEAFILETSRLGSAAELIKATADREIKFELSNALVEELCKFKATVNFSNILKIQNQISRFFENQELKPIYYDIITALSQKITIETSKHHRLSVDFMKSRSSRYDIIKALNKSINLHKN